ncbi:MAG TPA: LysM peptidoglycan-binding domain-containing protein [bacterium]|nr:LysM peptidoglycan-binding domain-containing protein [bacterium]
MKFIVLTIFIGIFGYSIPARAGIFSFLENFFGGNGQNEKTITQNSQTVAILEGIHNSNNETGRGGGDITIVSQSALLPNSGPIGTIVDVEEKEVSHNQGQISVYVVRDGDNLSEIAKMFGVSVNTIIWANNIKRGNLISVGQTLIILPISGIEYKIKKSDSLKKIADKFKGNVDEIIQFNGLDSGARLVAGEIIIIPNGEYARPKYVSSYSRRRVRGTGGPYYAGYYLRPIRGGVKTQGLHGYNAVDLASSCGTPIMAAASGDVIISRKRGWNGGYGHYIVISHKNGTQTLYGHLRKNIVSAGWHVVQGQVIGYMGTTGKSTGCHVHFEVRGARNPF